MVQIAPSLIVGLLLLGCFTGFAAGLLGIGGGMLLVPFLTMMFTAQGFALEHVVHMAVATSLTTILFTSMSSVRAHHQRGAVRWDLIRSMGPGAMLGTLIGASFAAHLSTGVLALLFALFVGQSAIKMLRPGAGGGAPKAQSATPYAPGRTALVAVGAAIGAVSSLVGAGGGFITVPYLTARGVDMHKAVASSAAMGFPIALGGLLGYVAVGWNATNLPPLALGFIYLPALIGVAATSVLLAPLGARTAHALNVAQLKRVFGLLLLTLASYMLWKAGRSFGIW